MVAATFLRIASEIGRTPFVQLKSVILVQSPFLVSLSRSSSCSASVSFSHISGKVLASKLFSEYIRCSFGGV